jgi:flagellar biosynthesis/type III secretory pathway M-ring protein FliF/YscJ
MDFLKNQAAKIREQLAGLTPSQRMLAGSLAVIMVMTLMWWSHYAASSEMEELYAQDLTAEDIAKVSTALDSHNIPKKVVGSRIQVGADRKMEALSMLAYEQAAPHDTSGGFDEIIQKMNSPWNTDMTQSVMFNRAKEATLAQMMRDWPGVRDAHVVINNAQRRAFGEASVMPSATVNLKTKSGDKPSTKKLIESSAATVAGAVSGMQRSKVMVIIDGASHSVQDNDDGSSGDTWMELVKEHERYFSSKIQDHLRWLEGVYVTVSVDPDMQLRLIEKESYDKPKTLVIPKTVREKTDENSTNSHSPTEPGAVPNTGMANQGGVSVGGGGGAASGGGGEGTTSTTSDTETTNAIFPSWVHETIKSPAGASAVVGASVSIPRSYFVRIFKAATASTKEPDDATLLPFIEAETRRIKPMVSACVSKTPEDKVAVDWYWDALPSVDLSAQPAAATSLPLALTGHLKEIGVGALAVISLFMVSMMVRKGSPVPIIPPASAKPATPSKNEEEIAGEASEAVHSMEAMEIDDDSLRTEQMVSQVSTMVKENPDGAASLVKRWMNRA